MEQTQLNWLTNFIWGIADDVLRDVYVRGKYRDVILPMTVIRRLDAVLEPNKQAVMDMKQRLDAAKVSHQMWHYAMRPVRRSITRRRLRYVTCVPAQGHSNSRMISKRIW